MTTEKVTMEAVGCARKHKINKYGIDVGTATIYDFVLVNGKKYSVKGHRFIAPVFGEDGKFLHLADADTSKKLKEIA